MSNSPPASPLSLYKAQLVLEKAKNANKSKPKKNPPQASAQDNPASKAAKAASTLRKHTEDGAEGAESDKENSNPSDGVNWAKNINQTTLLLNAIEDSQRYRQAFGFKVTDTIGSGGMKINQVCRDLAEKLFPRSTIPAAKLSKSIENRVRTLKKKYVEYHSQLGQTGHGLIVENRIAEIISGTPIYNVWDKMHIKFPWYSQLHRLLTGSPVFEKAGIANSTSPLDTRVLGSATQSNHAVPTPVPTATLATTQATDEAPRPRLRCESVDWDHEKMDADFAANGIGSYKSQSSDPFLSSPPTHVTPLASFQATLSPSHPQSLLPTSSLPSIEPLTTQITSRSTPPEQQTPTETKKRKDPYQHVQDLTASFNQSRYQSEQLRMESKRLRLENDLKIQQLKNEEQERQRQHEATLIEKKILLAQLEARNIAAKFNIPADPYSQNLN